MVMKKEKISDSSRRALTLHERQLILEMRDRGIGVRETARQLRRNHSVVSRFISSIPFSKYLSCLSSLEKAREMQRRSKEIRSSSRKKQRLKCEEIREYVEKKLKEGWSPELIAGRLSMEHSELRTNHESIYLWIYKERRDLLDYLLRANSNRRRKRSSRRNRRDKRAAAPKRSIELREETINQRARIGDWEGDTIVSKQSNWSIFNLVERKSRYMLLRKISNCSGSSGAAAMISALSKIPEEKRHSITLDNGSENSAHPLVEKELRLKVFFCHPYCASERGTVENRNGYLRRFLPKKTDFASVGQAQIEQIQKKHNHRPMKCLGFRTPHEVFHQLL